MPGLHTGRRPAEAERLAKISVVLPTRNERRHIPAFLASLHPLVELIVVDASDDGTAELVQQLRPSRTVVIQSRAGIAPARQLGADAASGAWLVFTDADVHFDPGYFRYLASSVAADAFYGPKHATARFAFYNKVFNGGQRLSHRMGIPAASGSNMGVRRDVFVRAGGFRLDLPVNEDTELMMRVRHRGFRVDYVPRLAVRSLDDRRLHWGVARKLLHTLGRNLLLWLSLSVPVPRRLLRSDWGYWSMRHARRPDLRDLST